MNWKRHSHSKNSRSLETQIYLLCLVSSSGWLPIISHASLLISSVVLKNVAYVWFNQTIVTPTFLVFLCLPRWTLFFCRCICLSNCRLTQFVSAMLEKGEPYTNKISLGAKLWKLLRINFWPITLRESCHRTRYKLYQIFSHMCIHVVHIS